MRRLTTLALCGSLVFLFTCDSLAASPARRSKPAATDKSAKTVTPAKLDAPPRSAPKSAPKPQTYKLAVPSPEVKLRIDRLRSGARILQYTGYGLSGFGLLSTLTGVVLISVAQGGTPQKVGIATLITGVVILAGGTAVWAVGRVRMNKADNLLIKAQMRQVQLTDPAERRPESHALTLPKTHALFSAQLRF
jgi:hypothetical protein